VLRSPHVTLESRPQVRIEAGSMGSQQGVVAGFVGGLATLRRNKPIFTKEWVLGNTCRETTRKTWAYIWILLKSGL
jgi:hypothetical protein